MNTFLKQHLSRHKARINCLTSIITALFVRQTVNLSALKNAFSSKAKPESIYRRMQRFFAGNLIVKALIKSNKDKEPKQQGIHISQPPLFPQPFDPCPRLLYRVEIRAIGRKSQHRMSLSLQRIQRVLPLVEGGVVHHDHAARRQLRQQYFCRPCVENIAVHAAIEGSESKWHSAAQGTDNVGLCLAPSGYPCAFLPAWCIAVRTGDVFSEAAFIDINEWMQACSTDTFYFGEFTAFFFVCLAVAEVFF